MWSRFVAPIFGGNWAGIDQISDRMYYARGELLRGYISLDLKTLFNIH